jgi:putative ABC transport system substrate-binding protein
MIDIGRQTRQSLRWHCGVAPTAFVIKFTVAALVAVRLTFGLSAAPLAAEAQSAGKVYRIGLIGWSPRAQYEERGYLQAFREELRRLGWVESRNLLIEYRFADGKADRLGSLVAEFAGLQLDLIVTITTTVTLAATKVITATPIVFTVTDAVGSGIVPNLARPGGNVTGPSSLAPEVSGKSLELLREAVPRLARVAVFWEPGNRGVTLAFQNLQRDAEKLGLIIQSLRLGGRDDLEAAFAAMVRERPDALVVLLAPLTVRFASEIVGFARQNRLPTGSTWSDFPQAGGLMSYAESFTDNFRRAAIYADRILRGAKPADLPVEQPTVFELVINLKTARALGLSLPVSLRLRADQVIE